MRASRTTRVSPRSSRRPASSSSPRRSPTSITKRVRAGEGGTLTTDGPFAEAKEHLAGFYLLDVESEERAVEIAAKIPEAALGLVEVRPTRSLDLAEW